MKIHIVAEIVYGNEGCPGIWAFKSEASALAQVKALDEENGPENPDVLVIYQEVEIQD